jgi:hypothetical protein
MQPLRREWSDRRKEHGKTPSNTTHLGFPDKVYPNEDLLDATVLNLCQGGEGGAKAPPSVGGSSDLCTGEWRSDRQDTPSSKTIAAHRVEPSLYKAAAVLSWCSARASSSVKSKYRCQFRAGAWAMPVTPQTHRRILVPYWPQVNSRGLIERRVWRISAQATNQLRHEIVAIFERNSLQFCGA